MGERLHESYEGPPLDGSAWNDDGCKLRVLRGGSWLYDPELLARIVPVQGQAGYQHTNIGFRLAQDP